MKKFYISTPIYYSSGNPHIGHAYTTIMADCLSKYKKLIGYETFFLTGMDEHGQKIEDVAKKKCIDCKKMIDENAQIFQTLWKKLDINYDYFIRTTNKEHEKFVQDQFTNMFQKGYIYLGMWKSKYCVSCEENISSSEIIKIDGVEKCQHGHNLIEKNEESYFLKVKDFKKWILAFFDENPNFIIPKSRVNEMINSFLNNDFSDLSISRTTFNWGIKINENPNHIIYVWLDALFSYISSLKINNLYDKFWNNETEKVHLLSKEIVRFHAIYWPIFLKMLDLPLPNKILSHGWIITSKGKMSKSLGNIVDPNYLIDKFGSDVVRYYFMKEISIDRDTVFEEQNLVKCFNTDLANNYGNIVSRFIGMTQKYFSGKLPYYKKTNNKINNQFYLDINDFINNIDKVINSLNINIIINNVVDFQNKINMFIENQKPWELFKNHQDDTLSEFLNLVYLAAKLMVWYLSPVLTKISLTASELLNFNFNEFDYKKCLKDDLENKTIKEFNKSCILFERIK